MQKNLPVILCMVLMASCAKEGPTGPTGPAGPVYYGNISGHVSLYDMYGSKVLTGLNTVNLYLSPNGILDSTDASGAYGFDYIGTGAYSISASADSGYAATVLNNVDFVSGTLNEDIKLSAIPNSFITSFVVSVNSSALTDSLSITVMPNTRERNCIVFVWNDPRVSNNPLFYFIKYRIGVPANTSTVSIAVPQQDLLNAGFTSGVLVYYAAYSYVVNDKSVYEDLASGNNVYNAVNATPIVDTTRVP